MKECSSLWWLYVACKSNATQQTETKLWKNVIAKWILLPLRTACVGRGHGCRMRGMLRSSYLLILSIQPALLLSSCLIMTQDNANNNNGLYHLLHQNGKQSCENGKKMFRIITTLCFVNSLCLLCNLCWIELVFILEDNFSCRFIYLGQNSDLLPANISHRIAFILSGVRWWFQNDTVTKYRITHYWHQLLENFQASTHFALTFSRNIILETTTFEIKTSLFWTKVFSLKWNDLKLSQFDL